MNYEIIGTLASVVILIGFLNKGEKNIRLINILGAVIFVIYGILIKAFSVYFLNGTIIIIHCYKLFKISNLNKNNKIE